MKKKKKVCLVVLAILLAIVCAIPFTPYIFRHFMKPTYKSYCDRKEWYGKVNPEDLQQVKAFCKRRGYSEKYYVLVDYSIPSGKKRFFIYDLQRGKKIHSSYCMHGNGKGNTAAKPKFSNKPGSKCSSLGRYIMVGRGSNSMRNSIRLRGLDLSNSLAEARGILIHSAGRVTRFKGDKKYIPLGYECEGCLTVSRYCQMKMLEIFYTTSPNKPVLIYAKYEK